MKRCVIICNPNSGHNKKKAIVSKFKPILEEKGYTTEVKYTKYSGHAEKIIQNLSNNIDLVISLGGDGTFNEVVTGNIKRKERLLLSHIPLGTANDLGAMFGMGKNPVNNLKLVLDGKIKGIDICKINNQPFVYVAGLGKFVDIAYDTPRSQKQRLGYFAYLVNALKIFNTKTQLFEMEYTCNGETYKGLYSLALICNATRIGGIKVFDDVKMDDNKFEVLLTNITTKKDIIKSLYLAKTSDITKVPGFYFFRTDNLKIKLKDYPRKNWCIDGEKLKEKQKNFDISIIKDLKMLLPKKELCRIFTDEKQN